MYKSVDIKHPLRSELVEGSEDREKVIQIDDMKLNIWRIAYDKHEYEQKG